MKILVVSDTHHYFKALNDILDANTDADMLIHLGDGEDDFEKARRLYPQLPMVYVCGNCDYGTHEISHIVTADGLKIFCCHGHTYRVNNGLELLVSSARENGCAIALYGHTHVFRAEQIDGVFVMNPGSPISPRGGNKPTYGVITLGGAGEIKTEIISTEDNKPI